MFIEKTKHLYSRVEIKTLKQGKTMFGYPKGLLNPKLVVVLPCGADPKTPYPFPPSVSFP
jgi:hypothetical protein